MSANHQQMKSSDFLAKTKELERLKNGDGEALRRAEKQARESLERMKKDSTTLLNSVSRERRRLLEKLNGIENDTIRTLNDITRSTEQTRAHVRQLQERIQEAAKDVADLEKAGRDAYTTAVEMYQHAKEELAAVRLDPDYLRFAGDEVAAIEERLERLGGKDLSGAAVQAQTQMIMTDIYHMDILVSGKRVAFIEKMADALQKSGELLAKARNVRENNLEELDNVSSRLMDIDFWTDGCFSIMEQELKEIQQRVRNGQTDAGYSQKQLDKDMARLQELERIEDMLVSSARAKINLSYYRKEQGELIQTILEDDHRYTLISKGFAKGGDEREAYILRMQRHSDGAQIEVIINPGQKDGEADVYFRVDSSTYMDSATMASITQAIADELKENGVDMSQYKSCHPEQMPQFRPGDSLDISEQARRFHGIPQRQPMAMPS